MKSQIIIGNFICLKKNPVFQTRKIVFNYMIA